MKITGQWPAKVAAGDTGFRKEELDRTISATLASMPPLDGVVLEYAEQRWTQADLQSAVRKVATGLKELGIRRGDRIAMYAQNTPEHIILFLAVARLGAINTFINAQWRSPELRYVIEDAQPRLLVVSPDTYAEASKALADSPVEWLVQVDRTLDEPDGTGKPAPQAVRPFESLYGLESVGDEASPDDAIALWYTSGTTGRPKGAIWDHRNMIFNSLAFMRSAGIGHGDVSLRVTSCAHNGLSAGAIGPLLAGGRHHLLPSVSPTSMVKSMDQHAVSYISIAPAVMRLVLQRADQLGITQLPALRALAMGAADLAPELLSDLARLFPNALIANVYGASEGYFSGHGVTAPFLRSVDVAAKAAEYRFGSVGSPLPGNEIRIVDDDWQDKKEGTGYVAVRGPGVTSGYWKKPEATADSLHDGLVRVGDLGRIDEVGHLWIVGRDRDVINSGGYNVYASEVELVLASIPDVQAAAVVGRPDAVLGSKVVAYVQESPGAHLDPDDLKKACQERLAKYKCPREVVLCRLPVNAMGKVQKHLIQPDGDQSG